MARLFIFLLTAFFSISCASENTVNQAEKEVYDTESIRKLQIIDPYRIRAQEITEEMDDRILASHVLITGVDGRASLPPYNRTLLKEIPAGGVILFRFNLTADNESIRKFLSDIASIIKDENGIPPFISIDHEGGTVNRFLSDIAYLPNPSTYWNHLQKAGLLSALVKIEDDSFRAGLDLKSLGFNMNFAPVAESLNNENRDFLIDRSYGPDPVFSAYASFSFHKGMKKAGVLSVIKHFPGSAGPDPHFSPSVLSLDTLSFHDFIMPFTSVIQKGVRGVMAAHTSVPAIDDKIASMSPVILQNWLRDKLEFDGLIISDDLKMAAVGNLPPEKAAVQAISAGIDMILIWPGDLKLTYNTILSALEDGSLPRERLQDAVQKVIYEKLKMGLIEFTEF